MAGKLLTRSVAALAAAATGAAAAIWAGAPPVAALIALLAGAAAFALAPAAPPSAAEPPPVPAPEEEAPALPGLPALLDAVEEPMLVVRDRRVLVANEAARALLGAHIEGSDVRLAIRHPAAADRLGEGGDGQGPARTELVGLGDLGRPWEMAVVPLPDGSRLVRLADQSQARAAEQMRVDFVANASHELRTPLATLLGFLETLQEGDEAVDPETRARFVTIMFGEATRMRDLLDDLMSLSRIEADRFAVPRDSVDLLPLIDEVRIALKPLAKGRKLSVENEAGAALVAGDRGQLAQMLNNLVANALKYGRAGTPVRIRLDAAAHDLIRISVIDQGDGIAADHIPRLNERFYRVDPGRSRAVGGTGLGLAIVKHIVLRHRGRLEIESRVGEGTAARVTLPRDVENPALP
jgi:two-component system phosphate regulon sensor histidine kinase PhoR